MFTGIVEEVGELVKLENEQTNKHLYIKAKFTQQLKIDQSVAHNGVCLTVVSLLNNKNVYKVTAIDETLQKTNLNTLRTGSKINLERGAKINARLDGHIVQGHVDQTAICEEVKKLDGSWVFRFRYDPQFKNVTIEKGSITINGVSLTVVDSGIDAFSVAIIPYTYQNTIFKYLQKGDVVNLEFDVIGKYVKRLMQIG